MSTSRWVIVVASLGLLGGCTLGAPPGFSSGESWSFPLVGPLENGTLVVPVKIHDRGPYLFVIDSDAPVSSVDAALDRELELYSKMGGEYADESDVLRAVRRAEVLRIEIGTLKVRNRMFRVFPVGTYNFAGRQIRGVIGRDILADSLVFGFDRDLGMGYLATQKGFATPPGAIRVGYRLLKRGAGQYRHLVDARVNGKPARLHIDLGEVASQLYEKRWSSYGLEPEPIKRGMIDELGTVRQVETGSHGKVELGGASATDVLFVPYADRRRRDVDLDGTIGLGFFRDYSVWKNFDDHTITMVPRTANDVTQQRLARWGWEALAGCSDPGCARAEVLAEPVEPGMEDAPRPAPILVIERDPSVTDVAMELMLEVNGVEGAPRYVVSFPVGSQRLTEKLDEAYRDATFSVVDISPFPRACATPEKACAYTLP